MRHKRQMLLAECNCTKVVEMAPLPVMPFGAGVGGLIARRVGQVRREPLAKQGADISALFRCETATRAA